ncbi:MAG TPA: DUF5624 domain-containing protein [Steroidobacteraceae bacterium]|nr:DUF5624 domain-containing protein [Steroidobacteraceae bacterium]
MAYSPHPEFKALYSLFTPDAGSIGAHLNGLKAGLSADDPLLVTTGSDIIIFPGSGREPLMESFRNSTRGFVELTSISHLGVALPFIVRIRELGDPAWEAYARRLMDQIIKVRAVNTEAYWRETVAVEAWAGLESKITDMVDYSCDVTLDYLTRGLADQALLTFDHLRNHYLDPVDSSEVPVPINDMMAGTFGLVFLDIGHRVIRWLREQEFDWQRLMVIVSGRAGRPTAGLTWPTNSMCHLLWRASGERLSPELLYVAPHAPSLVLDNLRDSASRTAVEAQFRQIWYSTRVTVEVGRAMFEGYPAFKPMVNSAPVIDATTQSIGEMPAVRSPHDRRAIMTRLRFVMEDPAQQLANSVAHYIIDQLCACNNRPADVIVAGFTNMTYPRLAPRT